MAARSCAGPRSGFVLIVIHGRALLLAAYYGAHVGERALVISATARLVAPADLSPFIRSAPLPWAWAKARLFWTYPCLFWWGVKACGPA